MNLQIASRAGCLGKLERSMVGRCGSDKWEAKLIPRQVWSYPHQWSRLMAELWPKEAVPGYQRPEIRFVWAAAGVKWLDKPAIGYTQEASHRIPCFSRSTDPCAMILTSDTFWDGAEPIPVMWVKQILGVSERKRPRVRPWQGGSRGRRRWANL